jgi:hypothetical protein
MATTFQKIAFTEVGSGGASNIDFTVIPSTYTDLAILLCARTNRTSPDTEDSVKLTFNNTTSGYTSRYLRGSGTGATSGAGQDATAIWPIQMPAAGATASTFGNAMIYIPNYLEAINKSVNVDVVMENNATAAFINISAGLWSNTSAINRITLTPNVGTALVQYSTATLYGIKKA